MVTGRPMRILTAVLISAAITAPAVAQPLQSALTGSTFRYTVVTGDSLRGLAARFGVDVDTLADVNGLTRSSILHPGQVVVVNNRHVALRDPIARLVLNLPQRILYVDSGTELRSYPVAVGGPAWPTPVGRFRIIEKEERPAWDVPASIQEEMRRRGQPVRTRVPPGPDNPLGAFFIRLSFESVGIHGTNAPTSIYSFVTHGCIRLGPSQIADLYPRVTVGMGGIIVYEPVLMTAADGRIWLEVHPDAYRRAPAPLIRAKALAAALGVSERINWSLATVTLRRRQGIAIDITAEE